MIKVCIDPSCEAVYHNCPKQETRCKDCNGLIVMINEKTYWKKFWCNFFQYDFKTEEMYRPIPKVKQLMIFKQ